MSPVSRPHFWVWIKFPDLHTWRGRLPWIKISGVFAYKQWMCPHFPDPFMCFLHSAWWQRPTVAIESQEDSVVLCGVHMGVDNLVDRVDRFCGPGCLCCCCSLGIWNDLPLKPGYNLPRKRRLLEVKPVCGSWAL